MNISRYLLTTFIALDLSACVESRDPLLTQTEPTAGHQFQLNFYEDFQDGKAHEFHAAIYRWNDVNMFARAAWHETSRTWQSNHSSTTTSSSKAVGNRVQLLLLDSEKTIPRCLSYLPDRGNRCK